MSKIANRNARAYVDRLEEFQGSNIFAEWRDKIFDDPLKKAINELAKVRVYVVYSYGKHFPMYANIAGQWYGNRDKYSPTTSKQQSQTRPSYSNNMVWVDTDALRVLIGLS